jgi:DNA polymerase-3 subunit beta
MRIKVKNAELVKALNNLGKVIPSKSIEPILENVLLKANKDIILTATNLEQGMKYILKGEIIDLSDGILEIVLPFNLLRDITSKLQNELDTEIEINQKKSVIRQGTASYSLNCFSAESFAILPEVEGGNNFSINFNNLKTLIENTVFAASKKEESRKEFKGVLLEAKGTDLRFVATDSTALALNKIETNLPETSLIIPWKTLDILNKIDIEYSDMLVKVDPNTIKFEFPSLSLISLLINGKFPAYESVIPESSEFTATVKKSELLSALKRVNILASRGNERISLTFSDGFVSVESVSSDVGEGKEKVACTSNAEISLYFYGEKLISGIEHVPGGDVVFGMNGPLHPVLIKGAETDSYIYVIMPQKPTE